MTHCQRVRLHTLWAYFQRLAALYGAIQFLAVVAKGAMAIVPLVIVGVQLLVGYAAVKILVTIMGWVLLIEAFAGIIFVLLMLGVLIEPVSGRLAVIVSGRLAQVWRWLVKATAGRTAIASGGRLGKLLFVVLPLATACGVVAGYTWLLLHIGVTLPNPKSVPTEIIAMLTEVVSVLNEPAKVAGWIWLGLCGYFLMSFGFTGVWLLLRQLPGDEPHKRH